MTRWGIVTALALSMTMLSLTACGAASATTAATHQSHTIVLTDDLHQTVVLKKPATRIVAIEPSNAEIVLDLRLKSDLVGVDSSVLQYTPAPWKSETKGLKSIGSALSGISVERVVAARPNLVITSDGVKGVSQLARFHIPVMILNPTSLQGVYHDIMLVGKATGRTAKAQAVVAGLKRQFQAIESRVRTVKHRPTVFYDLGGLYTTGPNTFLNALIDEAGATNIGATLTRAQWPKVTAEQVVHADPDVILFDRGTSTVSAEDHIAGFSATRAVKTGEVLAVPNPSYTEEPSPGLVMGLEELVHLLHPSLKLGR
jgi:iron complex transport system substrate-binding protein